jgi:hypothetical protein
LHEHKAPELEGIEVVHVAATEIVQVLKFIDGVRSKGSCRMFTIPGMSVVILPSGDPPGRRKN